jgi:hypothetical protein
MLAWLLRPRGEVRRERIADLLELSDPERAARWRHATSDAGRYLLKQAEWNGPVSDLLERAADVEAAIEGDGAWEVCPEWRIGTESANRIERAGVGYRVSTDCDGVYEATVHSLPIALEALEVLFALRRDLFYEVGWASWAGRTQMTPGEGPVDLDDARGDEPYLARIAREAVRGDVKRSLGTTIRRTSVDWLDGPAWEVIAEEGNVRMTCVSPTPERANQYAGIFEAVQADLARLFDWT